MRASVHEQPVQLAAAVAEDALSYALYSGDNYYNSSTSDAVPAS